MLRQTLITTVISLFSICATAQQPNVNNTYKDKSNQQIVDEMQDFINAINRLDKLFEGFAITKGETVSKDELTKPFVLDTTLAMGQLQEAMLANMELYQTPEKKGSSVIVDMHFSTLSTTGETYELTFVPKKIYFYDGTSTTEHLEDLEIDFHFGKDWPFKKRIDSIECEITLQYFNTLDKVTLDAAHPKATYKGMPLELKKTDKNFIEFTYDNGIDIFKTEPLNITGKTLESNSSNTLNYNGSDKNFMVDLKNALSSLLKDAEKNINLPSAQFQSMYVPKLQELSDKVDGDHVLVYKKMLCSGNVKGVRVNIAKDRKTVSKRRMILPTDVADIRLGKEDSVSHFYDNKGDVIYTTTQEIGQINSSFYEGQNAYYYFNTATKKLEKLSYYSVSSLNSNFVKAQEDEDSDYLLLDNANKQVGSFSKITNNDHVTAAYNKEGILIISPKGHQKWLKETEALMPFNNGYAIVKIKGKYGFIDREGNTVIPAVYEAAQGFGDMTTYTPEDKLFGVQKNGKWGFVDISNKEVIPFVYDEVEPFSYGITMVKKGDNRGIITINNKVIAPFTGGSSYGLSTNFGKRMYSLGSGNYDHLGNKRKSGSD